MLFTIQTSPNAEIILFRLLRFGLNMGNGWMGICSRRLPITETLQVLYLSSKS